VFADADEARLHLEQGGPPDVDVHLAPVGQFVVLMREPNQDEVAHHELLLKTYKKRLREHADEFEANRSAQCAGRFSRSTAQQSEPFEESGELPRPVPRILEVRLQRFAVISLLPDHTEPDPDKQQPGFCLWAAFDTDEEAKTYARDVVSKKVLDFDLDVVGMYEWIHPTRLNLDELEETYRSDELTELMRRRKRQSRDVEAFRNICDERGEKVPEIVLGGDNKETKPIVELSLAEDLKGTVTRLDAAECAYGSSE
jgi:hypothetical protein